MSRHLLVWLLQTHAFDDASPRHDTRGYELPTVLGDQTLRYVHGGMAPRTLPWPGLEGVAPGQKGPADFGLSSAWPPQRPLRAERRPVTTTREEVMANVYAAFGWRGSREEGDERVVVLSVRTPPGLRDVRIDHGFVEHVARHANRGAFANYVLPTLKEPHEVWLTHVGSSRGGAFRHHFLAAFDDGVTAVVVVEPGEAPVAWNFFPVRRRTDVRKRRKGMLLYSRRQEGGEG